MCRGRGCFYLHSAILVPLCFVLYLRNLCANIPKNWRLQMIQNNDQSAHQRADFDILDRT